MYTGPDMRKMISSVRGVPAPAAIPNIKVCISIGKPLKDIGTELEKW